MQTTAGEPSANYNEHRAVAYIDARLEGPQNGSNGRGDCELREDPVFTDHGGQERLVDRHELQRDELGVIHIIIKTGRTSSKAVTIPCASASAKGGVACIAVTSALRLVIMVWKSVTTV